MEGGQAIGVRLAGRDSQALEDAYAVYAPGILSFLRRYVGPDDAEDVLQRTFLDAWRGAHTFDPEQRLGAWLFTIAHRRAIDTLRSRKHDVVPVDALRDLVGEDGRDLVQRYADGAEVRAALAELSDGEREVLTLAYFGELTQREIADRLGIPIGTVKARASRGTKHLAVLIREKGGPR
jgi:RNA polymerase sigma factor (sigma-70 family)